MPIYNASNTSTAIKNPVATLLFKLGKKEKLHDAIIFDSAKHIFGQNTDLTNWKKALEELKKNDLIAPNENKQNKLVGNSLNTTFGKWIYCCIRILKPEVIFETGVAHGYSSWIILNAMHKNKNGKLISIDLPNNDTNTEYNFNHQTNTGWLVPEILRERWEMHLGDAKVLLPQLLNAEKTIDIFFHDSDHSYEHMKFEFETSLPYIKQGGLILSDDVHKNEAFSEIVNSKGLTALQFNKGGCAIIK
jgi:predicted O-methyltransferase YrrM